MRKNNQGFPDDLQRHIDELNEVRISRRKQEDIIKELSTVIYEYDKAFFLPYILDMINHIDQRNTSEAFTFLRSPMKQIVYLLDLYFSVECGGKKKITDKNQWTNITKLLNEIENTYVGDIGFSGDDNVSDLNFKKTSVSLQTFLEYYWNAEFAYEEQTLERLRRVCGPYSDEVKKIFGFTINDAIVFCTHIMDIINIKLTECNYFFLHQNEWPELTSKFETRGISGPEEWINEPELKLFKEYMNSPGFILIHSINEIESCNLSVDALENIIKFLLYPNDRNKREIVYYAARNTYFDNPLISIDSENYLCPMHKFLVECFYNKINTALTEKSGIHYLQFKSQILEKKVGEIFLKLFGDDVQIFSSYYSEDDRSEQDLLIRFKRFYFIVEIKDCTFRAPMRDPVKAYDKIKSDFKKSIQYGYKQCYRVESKIAKGEKFNIYDSKTNKFLHEVNPNRMDDYFSIIVTQFRYGGIQTNLEQLLQKNENDLYPWSICLDDLEAFILALKKLKKGMAPGQFIEFLKFRENYHGRLICSDELELIGYFINAPIEYKKYSKSEDFFITFPGMADLFDAEYYNCLGFENEINAEIKRLRHVPKYEKKYVTTLVNGKDISNLK